MQTLNQSLRTNGPVNAHLTIPRYNHNCETRKRGNIDFRCSKAANSVVPDRIWPNFEVTKALMCVIVTSKYEKDLIKNS